MIPRTLFGEEHAIFRESVRRFLAEEIAPDYARWEENGIVDREAWRAAGRAGLLCMTAPEAYGGLGLDRLYPVIMTEEMARANLAAPNVNVHSDIVAPYLVRFGSEAQKQAWLPKMVAGEAIGAIAMTEPGGGSDLASLRTTAIRDGEDYVLNGSKTFISNGQHADVVVVAAKTDPAAGAKGVTLLLVEAGRPGFTKGRNLKKMGLHAQDTSELFFSDVRVPASAVLGEVGRGFYALMQELAWERMIIAVRSVAYCEAALEWTVEYARNRQAFGGSLLDLQHNRFKLADLKARTVMARVYVDRCLELVVEGRLDAAAAAVAKQQTTDLMMELLDDCVQLHGGYGYMWEQPICRAFADQRYTRIAGGSNETMLELVARTL